ncbi:MAG: hypothetical protein C4336_06720, partial [Armatimonadota bacterium]
MQQPSEARTRKTVLFVVIGIAGLSFCIIFACPVAAIMFPVFAHARERVRNAGCISNLKQLGVACALYSQDHRDQLPPASTWMNAIRP